MFPNFAPSIPIFSPYSMRMKSTSPELQIDVILFFSTVEMTEIFLLKNHPCIKLHVF